MFIKMYEIIINILQVFLTFLKTYQKISKLFSFKNPMDLEPREFRTHDSCKDSLTYTFFLLLPCFPKCWTDHVT